MTTKAVLITGGAGFIGSHLAEHCLGLGWRVTAVDSMTDYYDQTVKRRNIAAAAEHPAYGFVEGDLLDLPLEPLLEDVTLVFHLAAQPGVRASWDQFELYTRLNVEATQRLLHAARGLPLERVVLASSSSVYGDAEALPTREDVRLQPLSPYGATKVLTEHLARIYWRSFRVPTVRLRYFTVYGPRQRPDMAFNNLISSAVARQPFRVFGDGNQTRDFTFVADAVRGTVASGLFGRPGSVYNIGGGSRRSMNDVLETLSELLGHEVGREYTDPQAGDARDTSADISLARDALGFEPSYDFRTGLNAQFEWQRSALASVGVAG